jgi:salicylate hydroxylase
MAIEDALVLGLVCSGARPEDVADRLRLYDATRRNRASLLQVFSNAGQDEPELVHQEASQYIPLEQIPSKPHPSPGTQ